jgi:hypothetical protein
MVSNRLRHDERLGYNAEYYLMFRPEYCIRHLV